MFSPNMPSIFEDVPTHPARMIDQEIDVSEEFDGTFLEGGKMFEELLDPNYEPTKEHVEAYAKYLGVDHALNEEVLQIVTEGLITPLPEEWKPCVTAEGEIIYFNFMSGDAINEHPIDLMIKDAF